jgi:hypothetical protein
MLAVPCPGCGREIPVSEYELGCIFITCSACETRFFPHQPEPAPDAFVPSPEPPPRPRAGPVRRGELTNLRCHDCGARIYEAELVRREVRVGGSEWGGVSAGRGGGSFYGGASAYYRRVDLCLACSNERDERHREADRQCQRVTGAVATVAAIGIVAILGVFLVVGCAGCLNKLAPPTPQGPRRLNPQGPHRLSPRGRTGRPG